MSGGMNVEDALLHLHESSGRIEAKVDTVLDKLADHHYRLKLIERRQWATSGGIAIAAALIMPKIKALFGF